VMEFGEGTSFTDEFEITDSSRSEKKISVKKRQKKILKKSTTTITTTDSEPPCRAFLYSRSKKIK
jgi:hypothetical protein